MLLLVCGIEDEVLTSFENDYAKSLLDQAGSVLSSLQPRLVVVHVEAEQEAFAKAINAIEQTHGLLPGVPVLALLTPELSLEQCQQVIARDVARALRFGGRSDAEHVRGVITTLLEKDRQQRIEKRTEGQRLLQEVGLAGVSRHMADLLERANQAAQVSDVPVLIFGESGTGKQRLAEAVHKLDPRRHEKPFLSVNCAAISGTLAESALFGHIKGAFTGATSDREGYFRSANGGTLLLDEISELDPVLQGKLLRVLQERRVLPVGSDKEQPIDVRIVAATNKPLDVLVKDGKFRLDLYQRLNVIYLKIPSLRDRPEDVAPLVEQFVERYSDYSATPIKGVEDRLLQALPHLLGDGNVRELENLVRQMLVFKRSGDTLELGDLPPEMRQRLTSKPLPPQPTAPPTPQSTGDEDSGDSHDLLGGRFAAQSEGAATAIMPASPSDSGTFSAPQLPIQPVEDVLERSVQTILAGGGFVDAMDALEKRVLMSVLEYLKGETADEIASRLNLPRRTLYNRLKRHGIKLSSIRG